MDAFDETIDPPYLVPTHLQHAQSIGPIPVRTFFVLLATGLLLAAPAATLGRRELGDVGLWLGLLPLLLVVPFALPWLEPPAEHGAQRLLAFLAQKFKRNVTLVRLPPWRELVEADGLCAFAGVVNGYRRRETLGIAEQPELAGLRITPGVAYVPIKRRLEQGPSTACRRRTLTRRALPRGAWLARNGAR
jgi:hypothetical protein